MRDLIRRATFAAVGLVVLALAGCTGGETGHPTAAAGSSAAPTGASGSTSLPPRPKDITLDGVTDPCTLLSDAQQKQLAVTEFRKAPSDPVHTGQVQGCTYAISSPNASYQVTPVVTAGVEWWISKAGNIDTQIITVAGFPAVQYKLTGAGALGCNVAVGVADGQQVVVNFVPITTTFTEDQMCQNAQKAAGFALATLQSGK